MKKPQTFTLVGAAAGMLILILDGKTAIAGAQEGIELCIRTLIPSLFPFFILSSLLTGSLSGRNIPFLKPIGRLCGIPEGAESILAVGLLGGYPTGAQNVSQAWRKGQLSSSDANRLLSFCNNAGPSFIFGVIGPMFSNLRYAWMLWGIHILSALLVGYLTAEKRGSVLPGPSQNVSLTTALEQAVRVMAVVCGWVVVFRIILQFFERWFLWMLPVNAQVLLSGMLELSNGCVQLTMISRVGLRFVSAGVLLALGGVCVAMQTASAAPGLSLRCYLIGKLLQSCISFLLCVMVQVLFPMEQRWHCPALLLTFISALTAIFACILKRNKKISSIPAALGV